MKKWICVVALSLSTFGFAALSPMSQSAVEIQQILASEEVLHYLGGADAIQSCEKLTDGYLIKSSDAQMKVTVVYEPSNRIGPQKFHLVYSSVESIDSDASESL
jgi:hypothetical protein